jgi:hypothetical protein
MRMSGAWYRLGCLGMALALALAGCGGPSQRSRTASPSAAGGLFVDAGSDQGPISPLVYGTNTGPGLAVPFELQSEIAAMGLKTVTFPGGNWGDQNDIETYQVDQFIAFCREIGAEPRIVVRLKGGTAQQAADLVEYVNVTKAYGVKYWGIGNEADLYASGSVPGYTIDQYNSQWRVWASKMRKVDPSIVLVGPDVSQFVGSPSDSAYLRSKTDWLSAFLQANGDLVGMVSIHRYPFPNDAAGTAPTIADLRANGPEWDEIIPALRKIVRTETGKDLPLAVTEVNSSWAPNIGGEATMDSHYNAIWWADVLGRLIDQDVTMVDQFALAGTWGIVGADAPNPMYYTYLLYKRFGVERVRAISDDPLVSVYAARRTDGRLTVLIVNLGSEPATKPLTVIGAGSATSVDTWLFDRSYSAEQVSPTSLSGSVDLPAESVTLLVW